MQLADEAGMSVPSFHSHFRAVTQASPMQYLKSTRLHQARLLMVSPDLTAEAAATRWVTRVRRSSAGVQRLFGLTPAAEAKRMRESFRAAGGVRRMRRMCRRIELSADWAIFADVRTVSREHGMRRRDRWIKFG